MFSTKLKIAIIQKDTDALDKLLDDFPKFNIDDDEKEIKEVMYLLREAMELLYSLKDDTVISMRQIKKNLAFLKATRVTSPNKLNIRS